ncbi:hypothetical protein ACWCY1_22355 [Streptomyces goshikiensis]
MASGQHSPVHPAAAGLGPQRAADLVDRLVASVRAGDDAAIQRHLVRLAEIADIETLLMLRRRLITDVRA